MMLEKTPSTDCSNKSNEERGAEDKIEEFKVIEKTSPSKEDPDRPDDAISSSIIREKVNINGVEKLIERK